MVTENKKFPKNLLYQIVVYKRLLEPVDYLKLKDKIKVLERNAITGDFKAKILNISDSDIFDASKREFANSWRPLVHIESDKEIYNNAYSYRYHFLSESKGIQGKMLKIRFKDGNNHARNQNIMCYRFYQSVFAWRLVISKILDALNKNPNETTKKTFDLIKNSDFTQKFGHQQYLRYAELVKTIQKLVFTTPLLQEIKLLEGKNISVKKTLQINKKIDDIIEINLETRSLAQFVENYAKMCVDEFFDLDLKKILKMRKDIEKMQDVPFVEIETARIDPDTNEKRKIKLKRNVPTSPEVKKKLLKLGYNSDEIDSFVSQLEKHYKAQEKGGKQE